jgi:hypothetical protein
MTLESEASGMREFISVDPANLHLPPGIRSQGADQAKLARQIARHGDSLDGMPPVELVRGRDGHLRINDGVTRAHSGGQVTARGNDPCRGDRHPAEPGRDPDTTGRGDTAMTDSTQAEAFEALAELARRYPHWRLGQLVANVAGWADADVWDAEDEQLLAAARTHLESVAGSNFTESTFDHIIRPPSTTGI